MRPGLRLVLAGLVALALIPSPAHGYEPPEPYAPYQPQTQCRTSAQVGTRLLARWINRQFDGGRAVASVRGCGGGTSEHQDGRAIDWSMDATRKAHRLEVNRFLSGLFKTDRAGHPHARARRMGIMYVIWNDRMYASYDRFAQKPYTPCKRPRDCSPTLRHRDHVHISLSPRGARANGSWYAGRVL
jgi:hypothetical protein